MAGHKETPRQKMIGMMYLVLTALLALNVSKDLLNAFVVINDGLERTSVNLNNKNASVMDQFRQQLTLNQQKTRPFYDKATKVVVVTSEVDAYIEELKRELIRHTADYNESTPDSMYQLHNIGALDNYDIPTEMLIGSEPAFPKEGAFTAVELKQRLQAFREELLTYFPGEDDASIRSKISDALELKSVANVEGKMESWELGNFYHLPLAACITNLSKIQNDVRTAESDALKALYDKISLEDFKFDTIAARIIPKNSYVLMGEKYEADVFLAAFSRTEQPEMMLGDSTVEGFRMSDSLEVQDGLGKVRFDANREGFQTYGGVIRMTKSDGSTRDFPFKGEYLVARPSLTVAPLKMNVLYKGVENPLDISVPGVPKEKIHASITGGNQLTRRSDGTYTAQMVPGSPMTVEVKVSAEIDDGTRRDMGSRTFRVKQLPKPYGQIGEITTSGRLSASELIAYQGIRALYDPNFDFNLSVDVTSFKMSTYYKGGFVDSESPDNRFTPEMIAMIRELRPGTQIVFEAIMARGKDGVKHELSPIKVALR